ncbi:hypothetical protein ES692_12565 [Psychroserpens burtonensis]|uniref:Uncharacterized protein n=1 Tax=Psychroserpens burtonensis TaxID=49278 RepID=A0A5C7BEJ8_9FLAO|nr:DUF6090 family protein [Psychroserpens burtonensis]TXE16602.1 hypothetical protein ES692_12565 [Psychroserpens burtonensis]
MIKFFRKIRQNMLTENKFSKYLLYAIGEIILVVIGILIALSINNWNELRKTNNNQEKYLKLLKVESLKNLNEVNRYKDLVTNMNSSQLTAMNLIDANHDTLSESYLSKTIFEVIKNTFSFDYENSTLSELKNSGELKNVRNDSLRKYLTALEPRVLKIKQQEQDVEENHGEFTEYLKTRISYRKLLIETDSETFVGISNSTKPRKSNILILKNEEFENRLLTYTLSTQNLIENHYPTLENHLKKIINIIEKELNK